MTRTDASPAAENATAIGSPLTAVEVMAIEVGLADGRRAYGRSRFMSFLRRHLDRSERPLANASLETLRAFVATASVVIRNGRAVSVALLQTNGFSAVQIGAVMAIVTSRLAGAKW